MLRILYQYTVIYQKINIVARVFDILKTNLIIYACWIRFNAKFLIAFILWEWIHNVYKNTHKLLNEQSIANHFYKRVFI